MKVLVTGVWGFIGSNLAAALERREGLELLTFGRENDNQDLRELLETADFVYHLAGVMRPERVGEFRVDNVGLTARICDHLLRCRRSVPIVFSSSTQAIQDNPYGVSKLEAEGVLKLYAAQSEARVSIYRLSNVFGKWAKPEYTSVVATFCHHIARNQEISISDPEYGVPLIYIDDVVSRFVNEMSVSKSGGVYYHEVTPVHSVTLGRLAELIYSFCALTSSRELPDLSDAFVRKLYGTFLSYCDPKTLAYPLDQKCDDRGCLAEFIKSPSFGQIFVSRTVPGVTRGGHYHDTKAEKFLVLEGHAFVRFQHVLSGEVETYEVCGEDMHVIDVPPGSAHTIENVGQGELITLFWASEPFDPQHPDTYRAEAL